MLLSTVNNMLFSLLRFFHMNNLLMLGNMLHLDFVLLASRRSAAIIVSIFCIIAIIFMLRFMLHNVNMPLAQLLQQAADVAALTAQLRSGGAAQQRSSGAAEQRSSERRRA